MFLYLLNLTCSINIHFPKNADIIIIEEYIIANQMCRGYFMSKTSNKNLYSVQIVSQENKITFINMDALSSKERHFSMNTTGPEILEVRINRKSNLITEKSDVITYVFEANFNTFDKEVAKNVRIEPAVRALMELEKLLYNLYVESQLSREKLQMLTKQQSKMVRYTSLMSVFTLTFLIIVSGYQVHSMKRFFKRKKLI